MSMTRRVVATLMLVALGTALSGRVTAAPKIRLHAVEPARTDSMLVCTLRTTGLPDLPSRETLASGLPSALVVVFSVTDGSGTDLGGSRTTIRIEPDLWEQIFLVRTPLFERRLASLDEVAAVMASLGPIPVLSGDRLSRRSDLRVRARLAVHPLATTEVRKVRSLFGGGSDAEDATRREVSVGLGSLIRFFLGRDDDEEWVAERMSNPFLWLDLPQVPGSP